MCLHKQNERTIISGPTRSEAVITLIIVPRNACTLFVLGKNNIQNNMCLWHCVHAVAQNHEIVDIVRTIPFKRCTKQKNVPTTK